MKLSEIKKTLTKKESIRFVLPNGTLVPSHFHVTEVGKVTKNFIDCGGTLRKEEVVNFQLWSANDYNHRLHPKKLLKIIELSEQKLGIKDAEVIVEYQGETINQYGIEYNTNGFILTNLYTNCLAKDACGIPQNKPKIKLSRISKTTNCKPDSNCC